MTFSRALSLVLLILALLVAGCGGGKTADIPGGSGGGQDSTAASTPASTPTASTPAKPTGGPENKLGQKPKVSKPAGPPPTKLQIIDIVKGKGATATKGKNVTVQYVGVSYDSGEQFDASWDNGQPFPFKLGGGMVIKGWDQGVAGMKVGGRRKLVIPPDLAYGAQGQPPTIQPNATLIFDIDLLKVG